jgi:tetratricopeptide (TPR) repeat protein
MDRVDSLERYLASKPGDRFALYALALELKKAGRTRDSEQRLRELLRLHPTSGAGHLQLGRLLAEEGRTDDAVAAWREGLAHLAGADDAEARRSHREIQSELDALLDV